MLIRNFKKKHQNILYKDRITSQKTHGSMLISYERKNGYRNTRTHPDLIKYICLHFQFGALKGWVGIGIPIFFFWDVLMAWLYSFIYIYTRARLIFEFRR